jgi:hypothetical protein
VSGYDAYRGRGIDALQFNAVQILLPLFFFVVGSEVRIRFFFGVEVVAGTCFFPEKTY